MGLLVVNLDPQIHSLAPRHRKMLAAVGADVVELACSTEREILLATRDADAVLVATATITERVVEQFRHCKVIGRFGAGTDNIDLTASTRHNIVVVYVPDFCTEEVSNHALLFILSSSRQLLVRDADVRQGRWASSRRRMFLDVAGQTLGIVGFGRIGQRLARKAVCLGMQVIAHDPGVSHALFEEVCVRRADLETVLQQSDYVSLHMPLTEHTRQLIGPHQLRLMKRSSYLINCARGEVVDEQALIEALQAGTIAGAALDCLSAEPPTRDNPLFALDNVILTPHLAAHSLVANTYLKDKTVEQVAAVLGGDTPEFVRNTEVLGVRMIQRMDGPLDQPPSVPHLKSPRDEQSRSR
jgi:D-3-phosphoglycerate dehydrogenase / 2-oxoglutarate reductase